MANCTTSQISSPMRVSGSMISFVGGESSTTKTLNHWRRVSIILTLTAWKSIGLSTRANSSMTPNMGVVYCIFPMAKNSKDISEMIKWKGQELFTLKMEPGFRGHGVKTTK